MTKTLFVQRSLFVIECYKAHMIRRNCNLPYLSLKQNKMSAEVHGKRFQIDLDTITTVYYVDFKIRKYK